MSLRLLPIDKSPTCSAAVRSKSLDQLISAFKAARLGGRGAEQCLTPEALRASYATEAECPEDFYNHAPEPPFLYRCGSYRVVAINVVDAWPSPMNSDQATVHLVVYSRSDRPRRGAPAQVETIEKPVVRGTSPSAERIIITDIDL